MIQIKLLKEEYLDKLAHIWLETIGKDWAPGIKYEEVIERFKGHLNNNPLPLTYVALENDIPLGMASLRKEDGLSNNLSPWLGLVCTDPMHHGKGIARLLINQVIKTAKEMDFASLYLFTFDHKLEAFYNKYNFEKLTFEDFKGYKVLVMQNNLL